MLLGHIISDELGSWGVSGVSSSDTHAQVFILHLSKWCTTPWSLYSSLHNVLGGLSALQSFNSKGLSVGVFYNSYWLTWLITPWRDLRIYPICVDLPLQSILSRRRWVPAGPLISHLLTLMLTPYLGGAKWLQCFLGTWIPIRGRLWSANPECRQEALLMRLVLRLPSSDEGDRQFGGMLVLAVLDRCADPVCLWSQTLVMALMVLPFHQCLQTATEDVLQGAPNKHLWQRYVMERDNWTETGLGQLMRVVYFVVWWTCAWLGKGPNLLPGILGGALPVSTWPCAQSQVHKEIGFWVLSGGTWFGFTDLWDDSKHI